MVAWRQVRAPYADAGRSRTFVLRHTARYRKPSVAIPERPVDGRALLATVDLTIGAGGTMTRESALLGTPTYTVFLGELAAQDAELIRLGRIVDLRAERALPAVERRPKTTEPERAGRAEEIVDIVLRTVDGVAKGSG